MASVMAIGSGVIGECVEEIRIKQEEKYWGLLWCALNFCCDAQECFDGAVVRQC